MKQASNIYNFANKAIPQVFSKLGENFIRAKDIYGYTALMIFISSQKDLTYDNFYGQTIP